jgi:recombination protein RecT
MSIQRAVQETEEQQKQQQKQALEKVSPGKIVEQQLDAQEAQFALLLPRNFDSKKFKRQTLSAIKASPDLMECFATPSGRTSIFLAAMNAASLGLEPNTPKQECWLLPRRIKGILECQFSIGYRGYVKLIWGSGGVETIYFDVVRSEDDYEFSRTLKADMFRHTPTGRGELVEAYAGVRYLDGAYSFIRLTKEQVYERRAKSDSWNNQKARPYSPWTTSEEAMWKKSALRALVPSLRLSEQAATELSMDESSFKPSDDGGSIIDIPEWQSTVTEESELGREEQAFPAGSAVEATVLDVDPGTGEIQQGSGFSQFEVLTTVMQEHGIEGVARLNKVGDVIGNKPKRWLSSDISEEDAKAVIDHLDQTLI